MYDTAKFLSCYPSAHVEVPNLFVDEFRDLLKSLGFIAVTVRKDDEDTVFTARRSRKS